MEIYEIVFCIDYLGNFQYFHKLLQKFPTHGNFLTILFSKIIYHIFKIRVVKLIKDFKSRIWN